MTPSSDLLLPRNNSLTSLPGHSTVLQGAGGGGPISVAVWDLAAFLKAACQVGVGTQVGPMGIAPTPVAEGEVRSVHGGYSERRVLSNNGACGLLCMQPAKKLLNR